MTKQNNLLKRVSLITCHIVWMSLVFSSIVLAKNPHICPQHTITDLWSQIQTEMQQRSTLQASFNVAVKHGKKRENFDLILAAEYPQKIFLQILDEMGQRRYQVIADGTQLVYWDDVKSLKETKDYRSEDTLKFLGLKIRLEDLLNILLIHFDVQGPWTWQMKKSYCELKNKNTKIAIALDKAQIIQFSQKKPKYNVVYQYQELALQKITLYLRKPKLQIELSVNQYKINAIIKPELFQL